MSYDQGAQLTIPAPLWTTIHFPDGLHVQLLDAATCKDSVEAGLGDDHAFFHRPFILFFISYATGSECYILA